MLGSLAYPSCAMPYEMTLEVAALHPARINSSGSL
jgi:hypothetical protein